MATIKITRKHTLDEAQMRSQIEALAEKFAGQIGLSYHWQGNQLNLERSGASGYIRMQPGELLLELKLGMLLSPLKGRIEKEIDDYLDKHLS